MPGGCRPDPRGHVAHLRIGFAPQRERIGMLAGDVNGNGSVTAADLSAVDAVLSQSVTGANFLRDVNLSGTLTIADLLALNRESFDAGHFQTAYHILESARHCAYDLGDDSALRSTAVVRRASPPPGTR